MRATYFRRVPLLFAVLLSSLVGVGCREAKSPLVTDPVPQALHDLESTAEHTFDAALAGDIATARSEGVSLETKWRAYRPSSIKAGLSDADARRVDAAISDLRRSADQNVSPPVLARAANGVSAPMDVLFAVYSPPTPPAVIRLDYLGREILLDGQESKMAEARAHLSDAQAVWAALRARVVRGGGSAEASELDAAFRAIDAAIVAANPGATKAAAQEELDVIDKVEAVYNRPPPNEAD